MRFYRQLSQGKELKTIFKYARKTCNNEMKGALEDACDHAVTAAQFAAPVYDPVKWAAWAKWSHHDIPPGTLKESIRHTKASCQLRGKSYKIQFRADADFADEMENGFRHHLTRPKRTIPGHFYMRSAYNKVFIPTWKLKMREATERMFTGKVI